MAYTYTYVPNGNLESGKPARATDMRAIRDMAPAIAEGADGAPKVMREALGGSLFLATGSASGTNPVAFTSIGKTRCFLVFAYCNITATSAIQASVTTDGVNWGSYFNVSSFVGTSGYLVLGVSLVAGTSAASGGGEYSTQAKTFTAAPTATGIRFRLSHGAGAINVMLFAAGTGVS